MKETEVKEKAVRMAVVEQWSEEHIRNRLVLELDLPPVLVNRVISWLFKPIKDIEYDLLFGDRVREKRLKMGGTQQELSELSGIKMNTIRSIEKKKSLMPHPGTVTKLEEGLHKMAVRRYNQNHWKKINAKDSEGQ